MSKNFNLLLLHSKTDIHPRTWVCLSGMRLKSYFQIMERTVRNKNKLSRNALAKLISSKYWCSVNTVGRILQGNTKYYPIPILLEILKLTKNSKNVANQINKDTEYLKVNSASAKPTKTVKKLNKNLSKILGAFMADGSLSIQVIFASVNPMDLNKLKNILIKSEVKHSLGKAPSRRENYISIQINKLNIKFVNKLIDKYRDLKIQTHYNIELTDEYKDSVDAFNKWVKEEFGVKPNRFEKKKNAWRTSFSNKIMARYLMKFFGVWPGVKTYDAFEPKIIQKSGLSFRKSFAKGVLMFDGCVTKNSRIAFSTKSYILFKSIKEIWGKDKVETTEYYSKKRGEFNISTTAKNNSKKLINYFEKNTQKEKLLRWLSGDISSQPIIKSSSSLSVGNLLKFLKKVKKCDSELLKNKYNCSHSTIRSYLKILKNQGRIELSDQVDGITEYVGKKAAVYLRPKFHNAIFKKIKEDFITNKNFGGFLEIHKATLSAWKLKKSRMPLYKLKEICDALKINFNGVLKNVVKLDREVASIIQ